MKNMLKITAIFGLIGTSLAIHCGDGSGKSELNQALWKAVYTNNIAAVRHLLDAGANANYSTPWIGVPGANRPVVFKAETPEMLTLLLEYHADPNAIDWDGTPLLIFY